MIDCLGIGWLGFKLEGMGVRVWFGVDGGWKVWLKTDSWKKTVLV